MTEYNNFAFNADGTYTPLITVESGSKLLITDLAKGINGKARVNVENAELEITNVRGNAFNAASCTVTLQNSILTKRFRCSNWLRRCN